MPASALSVVCAWCRRIVKSGPPGAYVTHTICPSCIEWAIAHPSAATHEEDEVMADFVRPLSKPLSE